MSTQQQYQVVWAYASVRVIDGATGQPTIRGFAEGGVLPPTADPADVKRLLGKGAIVVLGASPEPDPVIVPAPEPEPDPEPEPEEPEPGPVFYPGPEPMVPAASERPKDYASKGEWVDYAVAQRDAGVAEADARAVAELSSKADLIAEFG